ncbi:ATP/GTP-binding protein [Streptomyces glaucosporus]|uniref:ATP/GTP-binding protein n=1 Tax=Streptomyces glaucosporus TaxID=284044 RepID=A0ABP5VSN6_9ACTN
MVLEGTGRCRERDGGRLREDAGGAPATLKVLVAGGPGAGKTTLVGAVSEVGPLRTRELLTEAGRPFGDPGGAPEEWGAGRAATVTMDFGRITLSGALTLCLIGAPDRDPSRSLWDELVEGALGAVVLVDPRRPGDCSETVGHLERRAVPFAVAVNRFEGAGHHPPEAVRAALGLDAGVPVLPCDARRRDSARRVLLSVVEHAMRADAARRRGTVG